MQRVHDRQATQLPPNALVRPVEVEDPYEAGATIVAIQSLRDDPLGRLFAAKAIDKAQYEAGRKMQGFYERATIGGVKAMDTTKEPVDGGGFAETLTESIQRAIAEIGRLEAKLGPIDGPIVRCVLRDGLFLRQVAIKFGFDERSERAQRYYARRFRDALETLAIELHLAGATL